MSDIEVLRTEEGKPYVKLNNSRENPLYNLEKYRIHVSISHCKEYATSVAILEAR